jgi:hypothetical protein
LSGTESFGVADANFLLIKTNWQSIISGNSFKDSCYFVVDYNWFAVELNSSLEDVHRRMTRLTRNSDV